MCFWLVLSLFLRPLGGAREPSHPENTPNAGGHPTNSSFSANKKHMWGSLLPQREKTKLGLGSWDSRYWRCLYRTSWGCHWQCFLKILHRVIKKLWCQKSLESAASLRIFPVRPNRSITVLTTNWIKVSLARVCRLRCLVQ